VVSVVDLPELSVTITVGDTLLQLKPLSVTMMSYSSLLAEPAATSPHEAPGRAAVRQALRAASVRISLTISARPTSNMPTIRTQSMGGGTANSVAGTASRLRPRSRSDCIMTVASHGVLAKRVLAAELGASREEVAER